VLTSSHNDQFKYWKSLLQSKGLRESKHFLLSGKKIISEVLQDKVNLAQIKFILLDQSSFDSGQLTEFKSPGLMDIPCVVLSNSLFKELDVLGTKYMILVMEQPEIATWEPQHNPEGLEVLCPLGDPQNLGAVIRTAYAFGVNSLVLLQEAAHPFLPKTIKSSSGAVLKIPLKQGPSMSQLCLSLDQSQQQYHQQKHLQQKYQQQSDCHHQITPIYALDLKGTPLNSRSWPIESMRLLLGEEGKGIPSDFRGERIHLPMPKPMESLNAAVAAGIAIYQLSMSATTANQ